MLKKDASEYLNNFKPEIKDDWKELVAQGREIGSGIPDRVSRFCEENGYDHYVQFRREKMEEGKVLWALVVGRATLENQVKAVKTVYDYAHSRGRDDVYFQCIASPLNALPRDMREKAPKTTSYVMYEPGDWLAHSEAAPIDIGFGDHHLAVPNGIETTVNALNAGASRVGEFSQFIWRHPGFSDEYERCKIVVKSLGIASAKAKNMLTVNTYPEDSLGGYFMDCVSIVAYTLLESRIVQDLCGARMSLSFGGLLGSIESRIGVATAIHKLLGNDEHLILTYFNNSTHQSWDHDLVSNYSLTSHECLMEIIAERHYKMGITINPVAITEKLQVPTLEEQLNVYEVGRRMEEFAKDWEKYIDFSKWDEIRDTMAEQAEVMYANMIEGLTDAGMNVDDPLELMLFLQNVDYAKFEQIFHPSTYNKDSTDLDVFYPTAMGETTLEMKNAILKDMMEKGYNENTLKGIKVALAAGDCHTYGLICVESVLNALGADVENGSVDLSPVELLDFADENGLEKVAVSVHNGQSLDYAKQLLALQKERDKNYTFFMGGRLNTILEGDSVPTEVGDRINELGVHATNDFEELINNIKNS